MSSANKQKIDKAIALELLFSALGYLRGAGISVRGSNVSAGLAIVLDGVYLNDKGLPVVAKAAPTAITGTTGTESEDRE